MPKKQCHEYDSEDDHCDQQDCTRGISARLGERRTRAEAARRNCNQRHANQACSALPVDTLHDAQSLEVFTPDGLSSPPCSKLNRAPETNEKKHQRSEAERDA